jgi:hypothetical protein
LFNSGNLTNAFSRQLAAGEIFPANFSIAGGSVSNTYALPLQAFNWSNNWSNSGDLAAFIGSGSFTFPLAASASYIGQAENGFGVIYGESHIKAKLVMDYFFNPATTVPEPEISVMFLVGLGFTAFWLRKKKAGAVNS